MKTDNLRDTDMN